MGSKQERLKDSNSWLPLFIWPARDARIQYSCQFRTSPKLYLTPASKYQHFQAVIFGASKPSMAASCGLEDTSSWISKKCWHGKLNTQTVLGWITSCRFLWNAKPLTNAWCPESFAEAQNSIFVFWINSIVQKTRRYSNQDGWARPSNPERELCVDSDYNERYLKHLEIWLNCWPLLPSSKIKVSFTSGTPSQNTDHDFVMNLWAFQHAKKDPRPPRPMPTPPTTSKRQSELDSRRPWLGFLGRNSSVWEKK